MEKNKTIVKELKCKDCDEIIHLVIKVLDCGDIEITIKCTYCCNEIVEVINLTKPLPAN